MPKTLTTWLIPLALAGVVAGCHRGEKPGAVAKPAMNPIPVSVQGASPQAVAQELIVNGSVIARSQVNVMPKITGRVVTLKVAEGDRVHRGQVLAVLDTPELSWQLQQQQSSLISAQANVDNANDTLARTRELATEGVISQQQLKVAETQAKVATSQLKQAKASISLMESQLANGTVTSPIDGVVLARGLELGSMAMPSTPLVTLAERGELQVKLPVAERDLGLVREGGQVTIRSVALPDESFPGRISEIAPMVDAQTRLITVKVDLKRSGRLKVGMNVSAAIAGLPHRGLVVPTEAILTDGAEQIVYLAQATSALRVAVLTGVSNPHVTEVVHGLKAGDPVIVKGNAFVKDGYPIAAGGEK